MITFEEFGKNVHAICCAFDGAERVGIAAIETLAGFARYENDAERGAPRLITSEDFSGRLFRHFAGVAAPAVEDRAEPTEEQGRAMAAAVDAAISELDASTVTDPGEDWTPDPNSRLLTKAEAASLRAAASTLADPVTASETDGVVAFHEPEGVEPFDEEGPSQDIEPTSSTATDDLQTFRPAHAVLTEPLLVGVSYKTRKGDTLNVTERGGGDPWYPFMGSNLLTYGRYGTLFNDGPEDPKDIVGAA